MNRDILFRGKRTDFGEWVEGSLIAFSDGDMFICCADTDPDVLNKYAVDPTTVGQYTSLTDKNGVKIFEGDIIRWKSWNSQVYERAVVWDVEWSRFSVFIDGAQICGVNVHLGQDIEVIGNIHDNPEILKEV